MGTKKTDRGAKGRKAAKKQPSKRARRYGVPTALVAVLVALSLFFGGLLGFSVCNKTNSYRQQLAEAKDRIVELENYMTMIGFSADQDGEWVFDDGTGDSGEFGDLAGQTGGDDNSLLWDDGGVLKGMMTLEGDPVVVAEFTGGSVMSDEVVEPYNEALATQIFGFGSADELSGEVLDEVLEDLVREKVIALHAEQLGLTAMTDEENALIEAEAQMYYDEQKEFYASYVNTDGMTDEEAEAAVADFIEQEAGVTMESLIEEAKRAEWSRKLYDYVVSAVTVTDEEIQAAYDTALSEQTASFAQPGEYEYAVISGATIVYNPEGYRRIKQIQLSFDSAAEAEQAQQLMDAVAQLNPETDMEAIADYQAQLDALYATLEARAQTVLEELDAGASFDDLVVKYGSDDGMAFEPVKSQGYAVSKDTAMWSADFVEGCMMLENVGDVSTPVRTASGIHIIQYFAEVTPGAAQLADVSDQFRETALMSKQETAYNDQVDQWVAEADVKYYPERLQ